MELHRIVILSNVIMMHCTLPINNHFHIPDKNTTMNTEDVKDGDTQKDEISKNSEGSINLYDPFA